MLRLFRGLYFGRHLTFKRNKITLKAFGEMNAKVSLHPKKARKIL